MLHPGPGHRGPRPAAQGLPWTCAARPAQAFLGMLGRWRRSSNSRIRRCGSRSGTGSGSNMFSDSRT
eukprot:2090366-Pyramimonas_sp.AAC.1